ncbi:MAG: hypothetical protein NTY64_00085, partial [Deltaproteobacteria bacterium]|nr:hypothetical protein [Deltaproteobacteria bacterium]
SSIVNPVDRPGTVTHFEALARITSQVGARIKGKRSVIDAHIGGQYFKTPHPMALAAQIHQASHFTGLLGYLAAQAEQEKVPLTNFLKRFHPRSGYFIDLYAAYQQLWQESPQREMTFEGFLDFQKQQQITPTGYLDHCHGQIETLTIMRNYFQQMKIPVGRGQVVLGTGFKNLFAATLAVLMTREVSIDANGRERREVRGGAILVQRGHYHSLVKAPSFYGSYLKVIERIDADCLRKILRRRGDIKAAYLSTVANPTGQVMPSDQLRG